MKKAGKILGTVVVAIGLIALTIKVCWVEVDPHNPKTIIAAIDQRGARWIVADYWDNLEPWHAIMDHIASGEPEWIEVYKVLEPGTDAHPSEDISYAMSRALLKNPELVLKTMISMPQKPRDALDICGQVDFHNDLNKELDITFLEQQRASVKTVKDPSLETAREKCLEKIEISLTAVQNES